MGDRVTHFCLEYEDAIDLREMGFERAFPIFHYSELEATDDRHSIDGVSFVGHVLPNFQQFYTEMRHLPFAHQIAADFWSRIACLDRAIDSSAVRYAKGLHPYGSPGFWKSKFSYRYVTGRMSIYFRGDLMERLPPGIPLDIFGGDPRYLLGDSIGRDGPAQQIDRKNTKYHSPIHSRAELERIYRNSPINLNVTSTQFDTAVVNRVPDVGAVGGFILTDRRGDLSKVTDVHQEISYSTLDELADKLDFYLTHDRERAEVARQLHEDIRAKYTYDRAIDYLMERGMSETSAASPYRVDLGCGKWKPEGYIGVDISPSSKADIIADLTRRFPFPASTVDVVRAHDTIEHLPDRIHTMNEIWRVCKDGALVDLKVPSTDGRGAFQDPTHVSFWNRNSFMYYCVEFPAYLELCHSYGFRGSFQLLKLEGQGEEREEFIHVVLRAVKGKPQDVLVRELRQSLDLRDENIVLLPDWQADPAVLYSELRGFFLSLAEREDGDRVTVLVCACDPQTPQQAASIDPEEALGEVFLNILIEEGIDLINSSCAISFVTQIDDAASEVLKSDASYRVLLAYDPDLEVSAPFDDIPVR